VRLNLPCLFTRTNYNDDDSSDGEGFDVNINLKGGNSTEAMSRLNSKFFLASKLYL
jgi:hypothetical protein